MSDGVRRGGSAEPGLSRDAIRKETVMAYEWQSVEEAAVTLGVSTRTLHRRISKGEVETRLQDGRREVMVCLPEPDDEAIVGFEDVADDFVEVDGAKPQAGPSDNQTAIILAEKEVALANEKV